MSSGYVHLAPKSCLCLVVQVKNATSFDIHFLNQPELDHRYAKLAISNAITLRQLDLQSLAETNLQEKLCYRARLHGIVQADPSQCHRQADKEMRRWHEITRGIFYCQAGSVDIHGRVLVRLADPVTGLEVGDYLVDNHPREFSRYVPGPERWEC